MKQPVKAAAYMRLSQDDERQGESQSIETQRIIITQFAKAQGFQIVGEYIDDGWSGTNFDRPNFQRMIRDAQSGKVNCVITKDISRLGRDYIRVGQYLEYDFTEWGTRYISATEAIDTENGVSDIVPILNLFNEWHAKNTSQKIRAAMRAKYENGEHPATYAPIGYRKSSEVKNKLEIDPETCWIVKKIYDLAIHGAGPFKITQTLTAEKVPTASWINFQRNGGFAHIYANAPEEKRYAWTIAQVKGILTDELYIGNSVHYRKVNNSYKEKSRRRKDRDEWTTIPDTHEAIISKDDFAKVQELITQRRRSRKEGTPQIFAGLVYCSDCGWSMSYGVNKSVKKPFNYFSCTKYKQYKGACTSHYIRYDVLYPYVLSRLQYWTKLAQEDEDALLRRLLRAEEKEQAKAGKNAKATLKKAQRRLEELDRLYIKLYEDHANGKIPDRNFNMMSANWQKEQAELGSQISELSGKVEAEKENASNARKWVELMKQYTDLQELTAPLLNALISKIVVHHPQKVEGGTMEQEIEIFYRFVGKID